MDWLSSQYQKAKSAVSDAVQPAATPVQSALPAVATTNGSQSALGTAPEGAGYTATGARRHKKSRKSTRRKARKTRRRRRV